MHYRNGIRPPTSLSRMSDHLIIVMEMFVSMVSGSQIAAIIPETIIGITARPKFVLEMVFRYIFKDYYHSLNLILCSNMATGIS